MNEPRIKKVGITKAGGLVKTMENSPRSQQSLRLQGQMRYLLEADGVNWGGQRRGTGEIKAMIYGRINVFPTNF